MKKNSEIFLVAMRLGETPVHIPNTMVKTFAADSTMLETAWEGRWLPDLLRVNPKGYNIWTGESITFTGDWIDQISLIYAMTGETVNRKRFRIRFVP